MFRVLEYTQQVSGVGLLSWEVLVCTLLANSHSPLEWSLTTRPAWSRSTVASRSRRIVPGRATQTQSAWKRIGQLDSPLDGDVW
jgi:hypothetical protein